MNFYHFIKTIQDGIGNGCSVTVSLSKIMDGLSVNIDWENDFHYRFVIPNILVENDDFLGHFAEYTIKKASREFKIAEVGEE